MPDYISIIFVHHAQNEERSLLARASLKSLQETIHFPAQIIVVDNGNNIEDSKFFLEECQKKKIAMYIRNADNMHFAFARNQAMKHITGQWVAIVDNDIIYRDNWLDLCMRSIGGYLNLPEKETTKVIASPINYPYVHKRDPRWRHGQVKLKGRIFNLTERAGSNCMVMTRETLNEMGEFDLNKKAGSHYTDRLVKAGYLVLTYEVNQAFDAGLRRGFNFTGEFEVKTTLSDGTTIKHA